MRRAKTKTLDLPTDRRFTDPEIYSRMLSGKMKSQPVGQQLNETFRLPWSKIDPAEIGMIIPSVALFQCHHSCTSKKADHIQISSPVNFQSASTPDRSFASSHSVEISPSISH